MTLLWALLWALIPAGSSLLCNDCSSDSWDSCQITSCPVYSRACATFHQVQNIYGNATSLFQRFCTNSKTCYESFSINNGYESFRQASECCSSDLCNTGTPAVNLSTNGLVCCAGSVPNCQTTVQCVGDEEYCFTTQSE
ncbi:lymphocyte antigen 6D-like [Erpetoichthys calabaricus]|uniref:lymphocyte antigen 6D-like n=1 Tax=Erpetoichthys calabaricus TaxID=27687 RepID=UPI00109FD64E|nr:lymphocyte antigen 6D-like [Erpetoichthys calabaricus]